MGIASTDLRLELRVFDRLPFYSSSYQKVTLGAPIQGAPAPLRYNTTYTYTITSTNYNYIHLFLPDETFVLVSLAGEFTQCGCGTSIVLNDGHGRKGKEG